MLRLPIVEPIFEPSSCSLGNIKREEGQGSSFLLNHEIPRWLTGKVLSYLLGSINIGWRVEIGHVLGQQTNDRDELIRRTELC